MQIQPTILATVEWSPLLSLLSLLVGLGSIAVVVISRVDGKAAKEREDKEAERQKRADERHEVLCDKLDSTNTRISATKGVIESFRTEVAVEIASLHRADADLKLDIERRVAPIEGKLGIGRVAPRNVSEGGD